MAGHSKWAQIKRKKAANDNKRGLVISKHLAAIQAAVRSGGSGDPAANLALKNAIAAAKSDTVPQENINKAIERAVGAGEGSNLEEVVYEGYGPGGIAVMVFALTDNRNRTAPEVRHAFGKYGGNMSGGVAWMFNQKGYIIVSDSEKAQLLAMELGAEDFEANDGKLEIYTAFGELFTVAEGFRKENIEPEMAEFTMITENTVKPSDEDSPKIMRLLEALEDLDDVQKVYSNAELE